MNARKQRQPLRLPFFRVFLNESEMGLYSAWNGMNSTSKVLFAAHFFKDSRNAFFHHLFNIVAGIHNIQSNHHRVMGCMVIHITCNIYIRTLKFCSRESIYCRLRPERPLFLSDFANLQRHAPFQHRVSASHVRQIVQVSFLPQVHQSFLSPSDSPLFSSLYIS